MDAFLISLVMVFLAEMGDKTQIVALVLAGRYRPWVVLAGILAATGAAHVISVVGGVLLGGFISGAGSSWLPFLAGLSFLLFGVWTLRGDSADEEEVRQGATPFFVVFWTFLIAEMGDKTMLTTTTITAQLHKNPVLIWLGSTIGMVLADAIAIVVGLALGSRLPPTAPRFLAAAVFLLFGAWNVWMGGKELPPTSWIGAGIFLLGATLILYRKSILRRRHVDE